MEIKSEISQILTGEEIEALRFAQQIYGAKAKLAVSEFAEVLELDEETRSQIVGNVTLKLEGMDFEERRNVAESFTELTQQLGHSASSAVTVVPNYASNGHNPESNGKINHDDIPQPAPINTLDQEHPQEKIEELNNNQIKWLVELADEENFEAIASLTPSQMQEFARKLGDKYRTFKLRGLGSKPETRNQRISEMTKLLSGKTIMEIAKEDALFVHNLRQNLYNMANTLHRELSQEEIKNLIPRDTDPDAPRKY